MEMSLQELCREAMIAQNLSVQEVSLRSKVPRSSVNHFFSGSSKTYTLSTAGPICRVCGVSIDRFCQIVEFKSAEERLAKMSQDHQAEIQNARLRSRMEELSQSVGRQAQREKMQRTLLLLLSLLCAALLCVVVWYISFDYNIQSSGLIRSGELGPVAWIVLLLVAAGVGVIASALIYSLKQSKKWEYK